MIIVKPCYNEDPMTTQIPLLFQGGKTKKSWKLG